jgi:hypothetical protein
MVSSLYGFGEGDDGAAIKILLYTWRVYERERRRVGFNLPVPVAQSVASDF